MIQFKEQRLEKLQETLYTACLNNGLQIYLLPKKGYNETYVTLTTYFGSLDTTFKVDNMVKTYPKGIAHFLEHKLFEKAGEEDLMQTFFKMGADSNAFTSFDRTTYLFSATSQLEEGLHLLKRLAFEHDFVEESVIRERDIIRQEINMYLDDPDYAAYQGILTGLFPDTPLDEDIAGNAETIGEINAQDLIENASAFYRPDNMVLFMMGNIDLEKMPDLLMEWERIESPKDQVKRYPLTQKPVQKQAPRYFDISQPKVAVGFRNFLSFSPDELVRARLSLELLLECIIGESSKHYQEWYDAGVINHSFSYELEMTASCQFLVITVDSEQPIAMSNRLKQFFNAATTQKECRLERLNQVKKEFLGRYYRQLDYLDSFANQFVVSLVKGSDHTYFDLPSLLESIDLEDLTKYGEQFFTTSDQVDDTILPK